MPRKSVSLHLLLLVGLVWVCFGATLTSYFLADDFAEIAYVANMMTHRPDLLLANFVGNYMQVPGMKVYRPGLLMTIVFDWLVYGSKAWGYYLTNLLYFCGSTIVLYLLCKQLTAGWGAKRSAVFALSAATLFAVNPIHCESISWMVGRVDIVPSFFYLLSLLLFMRSLARFSLVTKAVSVACFVVSLSVKEMGVGLPVVATVLAFFWGDASTSLRSRALGAIKDCSPYWIALVLYFLIRVACIGTIGGGYVDGFGASQLSVMLNRWSDLDTLRRLLIPVPDVVAAQSMFCLPILKAAYTFMAALICVRLLIGACSWRWVALLGAFIATTAAPIYQLWGLGANLEGSRFYLFLSLPLSMLLPLLLFHPAIESSDALSVRYKRALAALSMAIMAIVALCLGRVAYRTNALWVGAGQEIRSLSWECQKLAASTSRSARILVLGIPADLSGAHMILNGGTFDIMLRPPFTTEDFGGRFITTIPTMWAPEDFANGSRLKKALADSNVVGPYIWMRKERRFRKLVLPAGTQAQDMKLFPCPRSERQWQSYAPGAANMLESGGTLKIERPDGQDAILFDQLHLNPLDVDLVEVEFVTDAEADAPARLSFCGAGQQVGEDRQTAEALIGKPGSGMTGRKVLFRVGHYWRWYQNFPIVKMAFFPPKAACCEIRSVRLIPFGQVSPSLTFHTESSNFLDLFATKRDGQSIRLDVQPSKLAAATSQELEISKPNYFFDNFDEHSKVDPVLSTMRLDPGAVSCVLNADNKALSGAGYYQLRVRSKDDQGAPVGQPSYPITLLVP